MYISVYNMIDMRITAYFVGFLFSVLSCVYSFNGYRYRAQVGYDGTDFNGWQCQPNSLPSVRTVQQTLNEKLSLRLREVVRVVGASRTDAGVHATGQAIHFDVLRPIEEIDRFENVINRMLPPDVKIFGLEQAQEITDDTNYDNIFHSRRSSLGKWYSYRFCSNPFLHPLKARYCALLPPNYDFNVDIFNSTLQDFVGTHNFSAFANKIKLRDEEEAPDPIRTLHSVKLTQEEVPGYYRVDFLVRSALYRMLRNVVGAAIDVSLGRSKREFISESLRSGQRTDGQGGPRPAPACGLCLETVFYNDKLARLDTSISSD